MTESLSARKEGSGFQLDHNVSLLTSRELKGESGEGKERI
jgi:hypothetical protein